MAMFMRANAQAFSVVERAFAIAICLAAEFMTNDGDAPA
jgi:hypothetical protein